tara:strand:+ start:1856 stop:2362 length:507 start_codon:yes stop_codon:yes gene_type:complete
MQEQAEQKPQQKRPTGLWILFILTTISTGLSLLSALTNLLQGPPNQSVIKQMKAEMAQSMKIAKEVKSDFLIEFIEKMSVISDATIQNFTLFNGLSFIFYAIGMAGAVLMFRGLKLGFHLYISYSLLVLIQYYFIVDPSQVPWMILLANGLVSLLFVLLYSRHLNWMK